MALQDLTPQLRTRLSRMERAVGWFVILATALLFFGFGYYVYKTADRKGWFLKKITYETGVSTAAGLKVGDPIRLMGYAVGDITEVIPNEPYAYYNVTIRFRVKLDDHNWPGYIWSDSQVKVNASDLLGNRYLEITKGATSTSKPGSRRWSKRERTVSPRPRRWQNSTPKPTPNPRPSTRVTFMTMF